MLKPPSLSSGGTAIAILDMVLDVARQDLLARHPPDEDFFQSDTPDDVLDIVVRLLIRRLGELRELTDDYRHVLNSVRADSPF